MFNYLVWSYRDDNNCWDYVRRCLTDIFGVPEKDVPKYGILPDDKKSVHKAYIDVIRAFNESFPVNGAMACHYHGDTLYHVGIVIDGKVREVGRKWASVRSTPINEWCNNKTCKFYVYKNV